jgi:hypothetical protein
MFDAEHPGDRGVIAGEDLRDRGHSSSGSPALCSAPGWELAPNR